jgi:NgoMIV restriction enzyme
VQIHQPNVSASHTLTPWPVEHSAGYGKGSNGHCPLRAVRASDPLDKAARKDPELAAALGNDYTITPDVVVIRNLESDESINAPEYIVNEKVSRLAGLRAINGGLPILHASISCKWTIRSDRVQNARSEALNLIRNRKGRLPHIVVVTGEPLPSRLSAIALGTGDIDCVYHFALPELRGAVEELGHGDSVEALNVMIAGKRLKDISDLPLDLAV